MNKETKILKCQNLLNQIEEVKKGLSAIVPDPIPNDFQLEDLMIGWNFKDCYDQAEAIKDDKLEEELHRAHNYYVAILDRLQQIKGNELTTLLTNE